LVQKKKGEEIVLFAGGHRFDIIDAATPPSTPQTVDGAKLISCAYFGDQSFNFLRHKISPAKKMRNKAFRKTRAPLVQQAASSPPTLQLRSALSRWKQPCHLCATLFTMRTATTRVRIFGFLDWGWQWVFSGCFRMFQDIQDDAEN